MCSGQVGVWTDPDMLLTLEAPISCANVTTRSPEIFSLAYSSALIVPHNHMPCECKRRDESCGWGWLWPRDSTPSRESLSLPPHSDTEASPPYAWQAQFACRHSEITTSPPHHPAAPSPRRSLALRGRQIVTDIRVGIALEDAFDWAEEPLERELIE